MTCNSVTVPLEKGQLVIRGNGELEYSMEITEGAYANCVSLALSRDAVRFRLGDVCVSLPATFELPHYTVLINAISTAMEIKGRKIK